MTGSAIVVSRLTPGQRDDYLAFFDHERGPAFADNPEWARCYCQFYRLPRAIDWPKMTAVQNRTAIAAAIDCGEAEGYLARAHVPSSDHHGAPAAAEHPAHRAETPAARGEVVGWMHAAPRHKLPHCFERMKIAPTPADVPAHEAAVLVCFVVAPAWRRRGVAAALLDFALDNFAARGIRVVDAFPFKAGASDAAADHYHGPAALFAARGFAPVADHEGLVVVRKRLVAPDDAAGSP